MESISVLSRNECKIHENGACDGFYGHMCNSKHKFILVIITDSKS